MEVLQTNETLTCAGCLNTLNEDEYVCALSKNWHKECFRCSACDGALSSWYFEKDGLLFCQTDYWSRYGESCQQCSQVITGPVMVAGEHRFHPECFTCCSCHCFIEDHEPYALIERTHLYCGGCYKTLMDPSGPNQSTHSIRVVHVAPRDSSDIKPHIRLQAMYRRGPTSSCRGVTIKERGEVGRCLRAKLTMLAGDWARTLLAFCIHLTCNRLDQCGLMTLHIGDTILEINGSPIKDQRLEEIERVLCCSDTMLQLTIESDPGNKNHNPLYKPIDNNNIGQPETKRIEVKRSKNDDKQNIPSQHSGDDSMSIDKSHSKVVDKKENGAHEAVSKQNNVKIKVTSPEHVDNSDKENDANKIDSNTPTADFERNEIQMKGMYDSDTARGKERLFKRKGDGQGKGRVIRRRNTPSPMLEKERSSSMSKLVDTVSGQGRDEVCGVQNELSRARSFRAEPPPNQRVFRGCDLLQGELLGCGFFGQVYRVTHRDSGEVMVLKQLYRVDAEAQRNFLNEVAVLRSLNHPNVLRFIGVLYKDKRLHLVTEYVAGGTLQQLLQESCLVLGWAVRARLARDIASGVGYLHRRNVIHRDLNSHNCLVREDKSVVVADFGLARIVQRTASSCIDRPGSLHRRKRYTVVGNPYWMAPEMMKGNVYDEKVDVFSFGIILCEIIGRVQADPDFLPRRNDFGLNESQFLDKFCDGCPEPLYRATFLCCDLDPDMRPPFEVLEIWLESLMRHLSQSGPLPAELLADILRYGHGQANGHATPECCQHNDKTIFCFTTPANRNSLSAPKDVQAQISDAILKSASQKCCHAEKFSPICGECQMAGMTCEGCQIDKMQKALVPDGVSKSPSNAAVINVICTVNPNGRALGKCVSASQICQIQRPPVAMATLSKSQNTLNAPSGFILRADGKNINITKVDDISEWLDPPSPLKRASPDLHLNICENDSATKNRKVDATQHGNLPCFLRNQSVEGLESACKSDSDVSHPFCRHDSIDGDIDSDMSDGEGNDMCNWYRNVKAAKSNESLEFDLTKNLIVDIVKKGEQILSKKSSYDVTNNALTTPDLNTTRIEKECRQNVSDSVKNVQKKLKAAEVDKATDKTGFFSKKLLSPKLGRLFKPSTPEVDKKLSPVDPPISKSNFFIQTPSSPLKPSHRVRPFDKHLEASRRNQDSDVLKTDLKLASMGKPMTPIFRRQIKSENNFLDGRFSYRDRRTSKDPKLTELSKSRKIVSADVSPLSRCNNTPNVPALATVPEKTLNVANAPTKQLPNKHIQPKIVLENQASSLERDKKELKKEKGISRSNYVSLANLRINGKSDLEKIKEKVNDPSPDLTAEKVM